MTYLEHLHSEHVQRVMRLNMRSPSAKLLPRPSKPRVVLPGHMRPFRPEIDMVAPEPPMSTIAALAIASKPFRRKLMLRHIIDIVSDEFGVGAADVMSRSRRQVFVRCRQIIAYLAVTVLRMVLKDVGRRMGGYDHSTIHHGLECVAAHIVADADFAARIERIKATIREAQDGLS